MSSFEDYLRFLIRNGYDIPTRNEITYKTLLIFIQLIFNKTNKIYPYDNGFEFIKSSAKEE